MSTATTPEIIAINRLLRNSVDLSAKSLSPHGVAAFLSQTRPGWLVDNLVGRVSDTALANLIREPASKGAFREATPGASNAAVQEHARVVDDGRPNRMVPEPLRSELGSLDLSTLPASARMSALIQADQRIRDRAKTNDAAPAPSLVDQVKSKNDARVSALRASLDSGRLMPHERASANRQLAMLTKRA